MATSHDGHKRDGHRSMATGEMAMGVDGHKRWPRESKATRETATRDGRESQWPPCSSSSRWGVAASHSTREGVSHSLLYPSPRLPAAGGVWPLHTAHESASRAHYSIPHLAYQQQCEVWPLHTAHERLSRAHYSIPHLAYQQKVGCGCCTQHTSRHLALTA